MPRYVVYRFNLTSTKDFDVLAKTPKTAANKIYKFWAGPETIKIEVHEWSPDTDNTGKILYTWKREKE